jgi:hypothetical protein
LATSLENRNKEVNIWLYCDVGHGADEDPEDFIAWIAKITGFTHWTYQYPEMMYEVESLPVTASREAF